MKTEPVPKRTRPFVLIGILAAAAALVMVLLMVLRSETTFEFQLRDSVSHSAVWDATVTLQDRYLRSFYQSDNGIKTLRFRSLRPGDAVVEVSAPAYQGVSVPVRLGRGKNRLDEPIDLAGLYIPGLSRFVISETHVEGEPWARLLPIDDSGPAIAQYPAVDLWIGARISVQLSDGVASRERSVSGAGRGQTRFAGELEWIWDSSPTALAKYRARLPVAAFAAEDASFYVIDYLIIVPKSLETEREAIEEIATEAWTLTGPVELTNYLDQFSEFDYYISTNWNVGWP